MFRKILGLTLVVFAAPALAGDLSYNFVQLGYQKVDFDNDFVDSSIDGDGFGISGSFEVGESWFISAGYSKLQLDTDFGFDVDYDELGLGVGWLEEEFDALGIPWARRGARNDEYIEAMRALWAGPHAEFHGQFVAGLHLGKIVAHR